MPRAFGRLLRLCLRTLPEDFHRRYAAEIEQTVLERLAGARQRRGPFGTWPSALYELAGLMAAGLRARASAPAHLSSRSPQVQASNFEGMSTMSNLAHEIRHAARSLLRRPLFTVVAGLALALGIGANVAIFSVVQAVLLRPLPFEDPDRLVVIWETNPERGWTDAQASSANYLDWREQAKSFEGMAAYNDWLTERTILAGGEPSMLQASEVTGSFFQVLGQLPALGTGFDEADTWAGTEPSVILSHGLWQSLYGGDPEILGQALELDGDAYRIRGVMGEGFRFPFPDADLWLPTAWDRANLEQAWFRRAHGMRVVGRLAEGVDERQAAAELAAIAEGLEEKYPATNTRMGNGLGSLHSWMVGDTRLPLLVLMAAVGFVLLIACANVANMLLARGASRRGEMATRSALGASRRRLLALGLAESLLLALGGGALGLLLGAWGIQPLLALSPEGLPRVEELSLDTGLALFALGATLFTGLAFGLVPAWRAASVDRLAGTGGWSRGASSGRRSRRSTAFLVAAQVTLTLPLVVGAGLMVRTLEGLSLVEPGFNPQSTLVASVALPSTHYQDDAQVAAFYRELLVEVRALSGVENAALSARLPFGNQRWSSDFVAEGWPADRYAVGVRHDEISPGLFRTMEVPLLRGRDFSEADGLQPPAVVIVNRVLAERFFPGEDPVGRRVTFDREPGENSIWRTIVGVVDNVHRESLALEEKPSFYAPVFQDTTRRVHLLVRTAGKPEAFVGSVRSVLESLDPALPLFEITTLEETVAASVATERFLLALLGVFALVALVLASVGILGVVSYATMRRKREIGIRVALGAERSSIVSLVLRRGMAPVITGILLGILSSLLLSRSLQSFLFEVAAYDPWTLGVGITLFLIVSLAACALPARWAARLDPARTLNAE